jgi:hypothetical protein
MKEVKLKKWTINEQIISNNLMNNQNYALWINEKIKVLNIYEISKNYNLFYYAIHLIYIFLYYLSLLYLILLPFFFFIVYFYPTEDGNIFWLVYFLCLFIVLPLLTYLDSYFKFNNYLIKYYNVYKKQFINSNYIDDDCYFTPMNENKFLLNKYYIIRRK